MLQSDEMAINKSKSSAWLTAHVVVYSLCLCFLLPYFAYIGFDNGWAWVMVNYLAHWITDYFTSRLNAWLYARSRHYFFVAIGFDQAVHLTTLVGTYAWLSV